MLRSVFLLGLVSFPLSYGCPFAYSLTNPNEIINHPVKFQFVGPQHDPRKEPPNALSPDHIPRPENGHKKRTHSCPRCAPWRSNDTGDAVSPAL